LEGGVVQETWQQSQKKKSPRDIPGTTGTRRGKTVIEHPTDWRGNELGRRTEKEDIENNSSHFGFAIEK